MKLLIQISILLFCSLSFAQSDLELDTEFSSDDFLRGIDAKPQSSSGNFDGLSEILDENLLDKNLNDNLDQIPYQKTPKLNPNTQIITTKNGKYIYHPNQEKGLYKINRENEYHYKYKKSPLDGFIHIKGGRLNLENFPEKSSTTKFSDLYDSTSLTTIYFEYEWQPFKKHRSISLKTGMGISYARGKGRFLDAGLAALQAQESYTFMMFPLSAGLTYKFKFVDNQVFMPFATGGINYNFAIEFRSSFEAFRHSGILASHFGGGVLLNLGWLERSAALELDKEFGINNTYLSLEGRSIVSFYNDKDINGFIFLAGLSFEY